MRAHPIFLVIGQAGEYSDHSLWVVTWRHTREDAQAYADSCMAYLANPPKVDRWSNAYFAWLQAGPDPKAYESTGTAYHVEAVFDDPHFTEIAGVQS